MIRLVRTTSDNSDFVYLVKQLDAYLRVTDADEHQFYNQFNNIDVLNHVVVAYMDHQAIGCGAFKEFENDSVEIKRMFTSPKIRSKGVATLILKALENWAVELNYISSILETGKRQVEAVQFYKKSGYDIIPNYGQYQNMENSICFKKALQ